MLCRELYDCVNQKAHIADFTEKLNEFWRHEVAERKFLSKIRLSKDPCKKLMDAIMPVARFLQLHNITNGFVQFPLNDEVPDCFLWRSDNDNPEKVEVTIAQGTVRFRHTKGLVEKGESHGFMDLQDYSRASEFNDSLSRERECYSTVQVLKNIREGIIISLEKKNDPKKYQGMTLLVSARLNNAILPYERWEQLIDGDILETANSMPFREIHVIGDDTNKPIGFRIK